MMIGIAGIVVLTAWTAAIYKIGFFRGEVSGMRWERSLQHRCDAVFRAIVS